MAAAAAASSTSPLTTLASEFSHFAQIIKPTSDFASLDSVQAIYAQHKHLLERLGDLIASLRYDSPLTPIIKYTWVQFRSGVESPTDNNIRETGKAYLVLWHLMRALFIVTDSLDSDHSLSCLDPHIPPPIAAPLWSDLAVAEASRARKENRWLRTLVPQADGSKPRIGLLQMNPEMGSGGGSGAAASGEDAIAAQERRDLEAALAQSLKDMPS